MSIQESIKTCHVSAIVVTVGSVSAVVIAICHVSAIIIAIRRVSAVVIVIRHVSAIGITYWSTDIMITQVRIAVVGIFLPHEGARVLPYLIANSGVVLEVSLQSWMVPYKLSIVDERRVFAHLFRDFTMSIQESIKTCHVSAIVVAIRVSAVGIAICVPAVGIAICVPAVGIAILSTGITIAQVPVAAVAIFQAHERVGVLADLLPHTRVILKICIELRMALQELRVVDQGRRFAKLVGNFAMGIQKLVKSRQVPTRDVIAWHCWCRLPFLLDSGPILRNRGLRVRERRET
jgi:hypothetical protein